ncbi:hypothetical protein SC65A3_02482 [Psychrobacter sp. SC65A.3]|nr:hypothetical protein SC65A3_02482 [Psychrobacter sp. SC65A.3]
MDENNKKLQKVQYERMIIIKNGFTINFVE